MSRQNNAAPIVIKRKKVIAGGGHHGGAWKVAYADFVTAMMAFFLMMWLLGATTESQRRGLADYFNPSIPVHRISSGGDGLFGGTDLETRQQQGPTTPETEQGEDEDVSAATLAETQTFEEIEERISGLGGESPVLDEVLRHVITRQTDEGLVIEIFDLPEAPLFDNDSDQPSRTLLAVIRVIAGLAVAVTNPMAIEGHTRSYTVVHAADPRWSLSLARADRVRRLFEDAGFDPARLARVTGHADRRPAVENPMAVRNNRLEVILLRTGRL